MARKEKHTTHGNSPLQQPVGNSPMMYRNRFVAALVCLLHGFLYSTLAYSHKEHFFDVRVHEFSHYPASPDISPPDGELQRDCGCYFFNDDITSLVQKRAWQIARHCDFSLKEPVYVVMESQALRNLIDDSGSLRHVQEGPVQILLVNREYHLEEPVTMARDIRLCGIRPWAMTHEPKLIDVVNDILRRVGSPEAGSGCGSDESDCASATEAESGSGTEAIPDAHTDYLASLQELGENRVKIIFRSDNNDSPSLLITRFTTLRYLHLYRTGQPAGAGLLAIGCRDRDAFCPDIAPGWADLHSTVLEDTTGRSDFLIRTSTLSTLIASFSRFIFRHRAQNSKTLAIDGSHRIQLNIIRIYNIGDNGTAISWQGYRRWRLLPQPNSAFNDIHITAPEGAALSGISFGPVAYPFPEDEVGLRLTNIHFGQGIQTGFTFSDDYFRLYPDGNSGNRWENSEGQHCAGRPQTGRIEFTDGTTCP